MSVDLELDDAQRALAEAVAVFCRDRCPEDVVRASAARFPRDLWRELAELGILGIATPEGDGGALEAVAAAEALGGAVFPGPLAASVLAAQLVPEAERRRIVAGEALACLAEPPVLPWGPEAGVFLEVDGDSAWLARPVGPIEAVTTLGGEPWGRGALARTEALGDARRALALHDCVQAAWLAAAGRRLVDATADHARSRKQFGRTLGEFQAVAHPLADAAIDLDGAAGLARVAAWRFDAGQAEARAEAAAARLAARRAAVDAAHTCHQLFGAVGITLEGPAFHVSRRILQAAGTPPAPGPAREAVLAAVGL